ncbi:glycosyltransferase family 4 protein [Kineococcus sp. TBRC 1896]|uniref:Glycosyltransferase family 4 protein n=1 Tax=Kineococcus mangrovi TaxID=1660183 RepID=A0ABV4HZM9_9ACTN
MIPTSRDETDPPGEAVGRTNALAGRRVLLVNWRDSSHPRAGGAEVYCEEIGTRFAEAGAQVALFTARPPGTPATEHRRGITIVREGGDLGVYARAARFLRRTAGAYDVVVDFQNGIPFFAPLFAGRGTAVVCVIHHVHQEQFALHYPWPASRIGQVLEGPASRYVYGRRPLVVVSPSTRRDVRRRLGLRGPIHVVPNGMSAPLPGGTRARSPRPSIAVVSRLVSHKRFDLLLDVVPELVQRWPGLRVDIAGDGPERPRLEARSRALGLGDHVRFHGFVDTRTRQDLMASAWLTVNPSQAEGWGLTVVEANAAGVPAVAHDVPGLRDSVLDGRTGWLIREGSTLAEVTADALHRLEDPEFAGSVSQQCRAWAAQFSWDLSAERLANVLAGEIDRVRRGAAPERRLASDLSVRVEAALGAAGRAASGSSGPRLRRSDQLASGAGSLQLLLHGCDEAGAGSVLRRLGAGELRSSTPATGTDLLIGAR